MCCSWGCFSPPERRWSICVVHPVTHTVEFHWLMRYNDYSDTYPFWQNTVEGSDWEGSDADEEDDDEIQQLLEDFDDDLLDEYYDYNMED